VPAPADAFTADWIADGGRAFVDRYAPGLARAVRLVLAAGGVPVLAHPRSPGYEVPDEVIAELAGAGLRGIEVFHRDHDAAGRSQLTRLARSLNLIMTGGSDDHGAFNNSGLGSETTPPEEYARLLAQASPARANKPLLTASITGHVHVRVRLECPLALEPSYLARGRSLDVRPPGLAG
jgi:hypothetical protein